MQAEDAQSARKTGRRAGQPRRRIPGIDGLRGLAILGVVLFHTRPSLLGGGFLGVPVFFAVSGFLTTRSLESAFARGSFSYGRFAARRLARLWPAVLATIAFTGVLTAALAPNLLAKVHTDALPAALFFQNWYYIVRQVPYFAAAGLPSPLTHLWFASMIMQFYLVWPLALGLLARVARSRRAARAAIAVAIAASTLAMALTLGSDGDTTRPYYGTDARAAEFLCGCLLALSLKRHRRSGGAGAELPGMLGLAALIAGSLLVTDGSAPVLYRGGYLIAAVCACLVVRAVSCKGSALGRVLSLPPLAALGRRSLSLYLVHYPLLICLNPASRTAALPWWGWLAQAIVIAVATEAMYRLVERPIMRRATAGSSKVPRAAGEARSLRTSAHGDGRRGPVDAAGKPRVVAPNQAAASLVGACAVAMLAFAPIDWAGFSTAARQAGKSDAEKQEAIEAADLAGTGSLANTGSPAASAAPGSASAQPAADTAPKPTAEKVPKNLDASRWTYDEAAGTCNADVLIIGDSITAGLEPWLKAVLPEAYVDGQVSRQLAAGPDVYRQDVAAGHDKSVVIVALGSNSLIRDESQVQDVIDAVDGKPLFFVTIRSPYPLQDANNKILRDYAARHDNVGIIDWNGESAGHDDYLVDDGTHLSDAGCEAYAKMVRRALCGR